MGIINKGDMFRTWSLASIIGRVGVKNLCSDYVELKDGKIILVKNYSSFGKMLEIDWVSDDNEVIISNGSTYYGEWVEKVTSGNVAECSALTIDLEQYNKICRESLSAFFECTPQEYVWQIEAMDKSTGEILFLKEYEMGLDMAQGKELFDSSKDTYIITLIPTGFGVKKTITLN